MASGSSKRCAGVAAARDTTPRCARSGAGREDPAPDDGLNHQRLHDALLGAMAGLSADHRAVVDLTYFHELGYREIAEIMGCPVDTVKTRMFHARRRLKEALGGALDDWL